MVTNMLKTTKSNVLHLLNPQIAAEIGEAESILLNQINYWLSKSGKTVDNLNGKWIYNSHKEWLKQFFYWSLSKLRRTIKSLENLGLIASVKVNSKKWNQTKWYTINYEKYSELFKDKHLGSFNPKTSAIKEKKFIDNPNYVINTPVSNTDYTNLRYFTKHQVTKNDSLKEKFLKKGNKTSRDVKLNTHKNTSQPAKVSICSKWTDQDVQNEQMIIAVEHNYTNTSSNRVENYPLGYRKKESTFSNTLEAEKLEKKLIEIDKTKLAQQMVGVWNKIFSYSISPIKAYVSKSNNKIMIHILNKHFRGDLSKWEDYAKKVNSSQFLMGEKKTDKNFKAIFSWLIKESTIESITSGDYGVGDRKLDMDNIVENEKKKEKKMIHEADKMLEKHIKQFKQDKEFEMYIKRNQWQKDRDKYGISKYFGPNISPSNILYGSGYQAHYNMCLKQYVAKKYHGVNVTDIRKIYIEKFAKKKRSWQTSY